MHALWFSGMSLIYSPNHFAIAPPRFIPSMDPYNYPSLTSNNTTAQAKEEQLLQLLEM